MRSLIIVFIFYLFTMSVLALAHPRLYPRSSNIDIADKHFSDNVPLVISDSSNDDDVDGIDEGYFSKRDYEYIIEGDEEQDYIFQRDFPIDNDESSDVQACYRSCLSKRGKGKEGNKYPYRSVDELKGGYFPNGDALNEPGNMETHYDHFSNRAEDRIEERICDCSFKAINKAFLKRNRCSGFTREGAFGQIACERLNEVEDDYPYDVGQEENEEYKPSHTPADYKWEQKGYYGGDGNELNPRKIYEGYYQMSGDQSLRKRHEDPVDRMDGCCVYTTREGWLRGDSRCGTEEYENGRADTTGDTHQGPATKKRLARSLVKYMCTTTKFSPLAADVADVAAYFIIVLKKNCRLGLQSRGCTRIGGIRTVSIGICDHYSGWEARCDDVGEHLLELIRRCERLINGVWVVGGSIFHEGWQASMIVY